MGHLATKTFYCLNMEDIDQSSSKKEPSVPHVPGPNAIDVTPDKDGGVLKDVKHEGVGDELPHWAAMSLSITSGPCSTDRNLTRAEIGAKSLSSPWEKATLSRPGIWVLPR